VVAPSDLEGPEVRCAELSIAHCDNALLWSNGGVITVLLGRRTRCGSHILLPPSELIAITLLADDKSYRVFVIDLR